MSIELLQHALQTRSRAPSSHLPGSVAMGMALPIAALGIVLIGVNLYPLGLLAWIAATVMIAFVFNWFYALAAIAAVATSGAVLWRILLGDAVVVGNNELVLLVAATALAAAVGQLIAREFRQREMIADDKFHLDVLANTIESIFNASHDCVKLLATDGSLLAINHCGVKMIGAENAGQMIGKNWFSLWGDEQRGALAAAWHVAVTRGYAEFDANCRTLNGERRDWRNRFTLVRTSAQGQAYVVCISKDVTAEIALQRTLKATVAQLSGLLDSMDDASFALDDAWTIQYANASGEQLLARLGHNDIVGSNFWEVSPIALSDLGAADIRRALEKQITQRSEYFHVATQTWFGITAFPFPSGVHILMRDITLAKNAQKRAAEETARLQVAQEISGFGDWSFDYEHGVMRFSSHAVTMLELQNCAPHEYKKNLLEKLRPEDRVELVQAIVHCSQAKPGIDVTVRMPTADGGEKHLQWIGRLVTDERGSATRMLGAVQDITARLNARRILEKAQAMARNVIDALPQQVVVIDRDGRYVVANETWMKARCEHYGSSFPNDNFFDVIAERNATEHALASIVQKAARDVLSGKLPRFEHEYDLPIATARHRIVVQIVPLKINDEAMAAIVHSDVTQILQTQYDQAVRPSPRVKIIAS